MIRISFDEYFMEIAKLVAKRSTCTRRQVGAVLVKDKNVLATGYNGAPRKTPHCLDIGCLREDMNVPSGERHELCRGLHAEQNAVIQAAYHGINIRDSIVFCTNQPCLICSKILINAGVTEIVYLDPYPDKLAEDMLSQAGVKVKVFGQS
jgi:dCMP deaminase